MLFDATIHPSFGLQPDASFPPPPKSSAPAAAASETTLPSCPDALSIHLMARVKNGDHDAFERLVRLHQSAVIGTIAKMLGDPVEAHDIAQQVFLRVWKSARRYKPNAKFTTWLFTITRNLVFNECRRRKRRRATSSDAVEEAYQLTVPDTKTPSPDEDSLKRELWAAIDAAIAALPEKQRLAVILRRYEDMPYEQIAKVLDTSIPSVKSLLFRARTVLKAELQNYLDA